MVFTSILQEDGEEAGGGFQRGKEDQGMPSGGAVPQVIEWKE